MQTFCIHLGFKETTILPQRVSNPANSHCTIWKLNYSTIANYIIISLEKVVEAIFIVKYLLNRTFHSPYGEAAGTREQFGGHARRVT